MTWVYRAIAEAERARADAGITGLATADQIRAMAEAGGLRVLTDPLCPDLKGVLIGQTAYLRDDLSAGERSYVLAHEIGHSRLDHGSMLYSPVGMARYGMKQEDQAHIFAGVVLWGYPFSGNLDERLREAAEDGADVGCMFSFFNAFSAEVGELARRR
jgi:Zn-dependent peptidase ImmA (M78 family)